MLVAAKLWWMIHKDLVSECRGRRILPETLLLGTMVAVVFGLQMNLPLDQKERIAGGLLWLAIFFGGATAMERSLAAEQENGCWRALLGYPVSPSTVYLAKLSVNVITLGALQCLLIPLFVVLCDVPLLARPAAMLLVALLGNLGISAVGTLLSSLARGRGKRGVLLTLLALPMALPVVLGSAEATRLLVEGDLSNAWLRWVQLLGAFSVVFVTSGVVLFEFVVEE